MSDYAKHFPAYEIHQYSSEEIFETLKRIHAEYPAVFEHFFMWELRKQPTLVSEEDMKYLSGEPVPLKITIPVKIEDE